MSSVRDAAFRLVRGYPGGAVSLAPRLGKAHATLSHEVAGHPGYKLGVDDAVAMSALSGDMSILNAFAAELGCLVLPVVLPPLEPGDEVMTRLGAAAREFGEFVATVASDAADGVISANEIKRIEREWGELVAAGQSLVAHLRAVHEGQCPDGRPRSAGGGVS